MATNSTGPVVIGFTNGIALLTVSTPIGDFFGLENVGDGGEQYDIAGSSAI